MIPDLEAPEHAAYADAFRALARVLRALRDRRGGLPDAAPDPRPHLLPRPRASIRSTHSTRSRPSTATPPGGSPTPTGRDRAGGARFRTGLRLDEFSRGVDPRAADQRSLGRARSGRRGRPLRRRGRRRLHLPDWTQPFAATSSTSRLVVLRRLRRRGAGRCRCPRRPRGRRRVARVGCDPARVPGPRGPERVLPARIEDARRQGCATVITETGELTDDRPSSSFRNIVRAGFREAGVRENYRAPWSRSPPPQSSGPMRLRGVSPALLVVAAVAACEAPTSAARTPLQIGSVVPELLDPSLQRSTVALMGSAGLGYAARVTVTWERGQTSMDPGLFSDLRNGIAAAREPPGLTSTSTPIRPTARRRRRRLPTRPVSRPGSPASSRGSPA